MTSNARRYKTAEGEALNCRGGVSPPDLRHPERAWCSAQRITTINDCRGQSYHNSREWKDILAEQKIASIDSAKILRLRSLRSGRPLRAPPKETTTTQRRPIKISPRKSGGWVYLSGVIARRANARRGNLNMYVGATIARPKGDMPNR